MIAAFLNKISRLTPTWRSLRLLGTTSAVRSANIWALVVPITAKFLDGVQDVAEVEFLGHRFPVHLSLPFSWKILFIAAIAFFLANLVVALFCPELIKETESYKDFAEQRRSGFELANIFENLNQDMLITGQQYSRWKTWFDGRQQQEGYTTVVEERMFPEAYAIAEEALARSKFWRRFCATILYALGMAAFAIIVFQNILFVASHW